MVEDCYSVPRHHPFGAHGVLIALPISACLWAIILHFV